MKDEWTGGGRCAEWLGMISRCLLLLLCLPVSAFAQYDAIEERIRAREMSAQSLVGEGFVLVFQLLIFVVSIVIIIGAICLPWWVLRIRREVIEMRAEASKREMHQAVAQQEFQQAQLALLRSIDDRLGGARIEQE